MFKFILLVIFLIIAYSAIRYFVKNKSAREGLVNQIQADANKAKKSVSKIVDKVEDKIKK